MITPVTFYEVRCDEPGCDVTTGSQSYSEYSAWADAGTARDDWTNGDGIVLDDGRAFCDQHATGKVCDYCAHKGTDVAEVGQGDGKPGADLCPACAKGQA